MRSALSLCLSRAWYRNPSWLRLLRPLSRFYGRVAQWRRARFLADPARSYRAGALVVIVGNITVGGTGKTPLTLALAQVLQKHGVALAIVSRGHGGHSKQYPLEVTSDMDPALCGDEALIYARRAGCPVVVDPRRARGVQYLEQKYQPRLILSDDGLQHYALQRDVEIVVLDGQRGIGNGLLLPQGPLREEASRLLEADLLVSNGEPLVALPTGDKPLYTMQVHPGLLYNLATGESLDTAKFRAQYQGKVHAVAGIGNPARFFSTLTQEGFAIISHVFNDHHRFQARDIAFDDDLPVLMTEKDAVKCGSFATPRHWYLSVDAVLPPALLPMLLDLLVIKHKQLDAAKPSTAA
jgi:tetraacyldisaccharide 4'-kinase